ncbi:MAG: shikimate kinase [Ignavibacteriales bacterium CG12_big_fil_rev_8_21_14_0_65_30_8]|nr:MAG: shikimate kinase [Ignavibacteriales bacterium CG12_big_fil_rev_8_21_14_0_65_30_8]
MINKIIYLAGFMATGKSTIGPILANALGWDFYDLDEIIEKNYKTTISNLFIKKGENDFRKIEYTTLLNLNPEKKSVVSLGGGTMINQANIALMKKKGKIILFETDIDDLYQRMKNKKNRPLALTKDGDILNEKDLRNKINYLLKKRKKYYDQADIKINTGNDRVGITVDKLIKILKENT